MIKIRSRDAAANRCRFGMQGFVGENHVCCALFLVVIQVASQRCAHGQTCCCCSCKHYIRRPQQSILAQIVGDAQHPIDDLKSACSHIAAFC